METSVILKEKKQINNLIYLCAFTYFISYITRINYSTVISEMVTSTGLSKSSLSWALTGSFITYGVGQVISGYFGDKIQPKNIVSRGLIITVSMNILIPFCKHPAQMAVLWCINGFAQALMWPPMVKLMTIYLSADDYKRGSVRISWGASFGTMFIYMVSPIIIAFSSWKYVFLLCSIMGILGLILWNKACPDISITPHIKQNSSQKISFISPLLIFIMICIALQGILRDGITTWMPSYISETYHLSNEISILTGVILPVFSILCHQLASMLYRKKLKNPMTCAGVIFSASTIAALLLYIFSDKNAASSVLLSAILTGCMHGINLVLICMIPPFYSKKGIVSMVSGTLNACTYIGSAISAYLFPLISENSGWSSTLLLWVFVALAGTLICIICAPFWNKFEKQL